MYELKMTPEMAKLHNTLRQKILAGNANADEQKLWKQLGKTFRTLSENPRHPGLNSHKIQGLPANYGDIWESYMENHTPGAKRIFWRYGPGANVITLYAVELHPENTRDYRKIQ